MPVKRALLRTTLGALLVSASAVACLTDPDEGFYGFASGGGSTTYDASVPPFESACSQIKAGDGCGYNDDPSTPCEVSAFANYRCNYELACNTSHVWQQVGAKAGCAPVSACPAAYTETNPDGCTIAQSSSLICEYDEGTCGCALVDDVQDADAGADADASMPDASAHYEWRCVQADHDAGCPRKRPRSGTECVRPIMCDYGACVFEDGVEMDCYSGFWAVNATGSNGCR